MTHGAAEPRPPDPGGGERRNVFVIGLDDMHRPLLEALPQAGECAFHPLLDRKDLEDPEDIPFRKLLDEARTTLDAFPASVDGVASYWDFPSSCLVPMLCRERGLPSASLEAVLRCEHKYWSRLLQQEVVPDLVPGFCAVDPFDPKAAESIELDYPFWIKPVKSFNSYLGFRIEGPEDLEEALAKTRAGIGSLSRPFDFVLSQADLPPEIAPIGGAHCIAEEMISVGRQCTVEGWALDGELDVYGVIDSIRHPDRSSFVGYEYPSTLPPEVQRELAVRSLRLMRHIGYEGSHFNIEYFWDEASGDLWLLEVNSRISQSHSELFAKVDGAANHGVMVDLALGREPAFPRREGPFACAGKFYERAFEDAVVRSVPDRERLRELEEEFPGARIHLLVRPGMRLSDLTRQDSYSYELAWVYMGAEDPEDLQAKHRELAGKLGIELEPVDEGEDS